MYNILVVEDEPAIAENITYALNQDGFKTKWFGTGEAALDYYINEGSDLIVLDVGLPDINGFELCKKIRENSNVPILFLTARSDEIDRIVGLEIGGDDYVVKPFSPRELSARIKAILRRFKNGSEVENHKDTLFEVFEDKNKINYMGTTLDLSRYEFKILKILINRPGKVYSRDKLMDMVWDDPLMSMDRTIDTHIKNLRKKIKDVDSGPGMIKTHRGIGYSLKEQE
jgi:two-component system catabolic regulation response regulator CreB